MHATRNTGKLFSGFALLTMTRASFSSSFFPLLLRHNVIFVASLSGFSRDGWYNRRGKTTHGAEKSRKLAMIFIDVCICDGLMHKRCIPKSRSTSGEGKCIMLYYILRQAKNNALSPSSVMVFFHEYDNNSSFGKTS